MTPATPPPPLDPGDVHEPCRSEPLSTQVENNFVACVVAGAAKELEQLIRLQELQEVIAEASTRDSAEILLHSAGQGQNSVASWQEQRCFHQRRQQALPRARPEI